MKNTPDAAETLDSVTQGASLFLDPTGAQVGDQVKGEEGIAYADLDLNACVEPKQFHDVVGYYQRYDVFDLKVNRRRQGPHTTFQSETNEDSNDVENYRKQSQDPQDQSGAQHAGMPRPDHGIGGLRSM